jgi:competence protein ComEA
MSHALKWIDAACLAVLFLAPAYAQKESSDAQDKKLLQNVCGTCHKIEMVTSRHATKEEWHATVEAMVAKGADASDDEFNQIIDYLAKNYGPVNGASQGSSQSTAKFNVNKATADQLASFLQVPGPEAAAIVRYRESNGKFKSLQDFAKIPGIDGKKVEAKKDQIVF